MKTLKLFMIMKELQLKKSKNKNNKIKLKTKIERRIIMEEKNKTKIKIRTCKEEDLPEIYEIEQNSFLDSWPTVALKNILFQGRGEFLVATNEKSILGYAIATLERDFKIFGFSSEKKSHLLKIAVREEKRRSGVGSSLLKFLMNKLKKQSVDKIELEVRVRNLEARKFYRKLGFQEKELIKDYYPDSGNAVSMVKEFH